MFPFLEKGWRRRQAVTGYVDRRGCASTAISDINKRLSATLDGDYGPGIPDPNEFVFDAFADADLSGDFTLEETIIDITELGDEYPLDTNFGKVFGHLPGQVHGYDDSIIVR